MKLSDVGCEGQMDQSKNFKSYLSLRMLPPFNFKQRYAIFLTLSIVYAPDSKQIGLIFFWKKTCDP